MCALKWYVQSLYRHLFLVDISKHARVTQKCHFLIRGRPNSHAPWPTRPKLGSNVAKGLSCDICVCFFFSGEPPPPPPWDIELRRGGATDILGLASSQLYISGGVHRKRKKHANITAKAFSYNASKHQKSLVYVYVAYFFEKDTFWPKEMTSRDIFLPISAKMLQNTRKA